MFFPASKFNHRFLLKRRPITTALMLLGLSASADVLAEGGQQLFPLLSGATITGYTGDESLGYADAMLPLHGDASGFFHLYPQALYFDHDEYAGSLGLGYRGLTDDKGILGAYVFVDVNHSSNGNTFWFVSPGVERLGEKVDFSANLYIPVSDEQKVIDNYRHSYFMGHSEYDALFEQTESVGIGADAELGFLLPVLNHPKLYVGGYYFDPKDADDGDILGVSARLDIPLNRHLRLSVSNAYDDQYKNTFKLGISADLGGRKTSHQFDSDLSKRMVDPIRRNLIATSGGSHTNQPVVENKQFLKEKTFVQDGISFFLPPGSPSAGMQDGTFENPYIGLTQSNVDDGNDKENTTFYFNSGTYHQNNMITFDNDDLFGRQTYKEHLFALPAQGDDRPLFAFGDFIAPSAFEILTTTDQYINGIRMSGNGSLMGIFMDVNTVGPLDLFVQNTHVSNFSNGMFLENNGGLRNVEISSSSFVDNTGNGLLYGNLDMAGDFNIYHSFFNRNAVFGANIVNESEMGNINILMSSFNHNGSGFALIEQFAGNVVGDINISHSNFNQNMGVGFEMGNRGLQGDVNIAYSNFNHNEQGAYILNQAVPADTAEMGMINIINSYFNNNQRESSTSGLEIENLLLSTIDGINITNSVFNNNESTLGEAFGLQVNSAGTIDSDIVIDRSKFNGNTVSGLFLGNGPDAEMQNVIIRNYSEFKHNGSGLGLLNNGIMKNFTIERSHFDYNTSAAAVMNVTNDGAFGNLNISHSSFSDNSLGLEIFNNMSTAFGNISIEDSYFNRNEAFGFGLGNLDMMGDLSISRSTFNHNGQGMVVVNSNTGVIGNVELMDSSFSYNQSGAGTGFSLNSSGGVVGNINVVRSDFNQNMSGPNAGIGFAVASSGSGEIGNVFVSESEFNQNGLRGYLLINDSMSTFNSITIEKSEFNSNGDGAGSGFGMINNGTVKFDIDISDSQFNHNYQGFEFASQGQVEDIIVKASDFNHNDFIGMFLNNSSVGVIRQVNVSDSNFNDNGDGLTGSGFALLNLGSIDGNNGLGVNVLNSSFNNNKENGLFIINPGSIGPVATEVVKILNSHFDNDEIGIRVDNTGGTIGTDNKVVQSGNAFVGTTTPVLCLPASVC